jgi:hypothetical protein
MRTTALKVMLSATALLFVSPGMPVLADTGAPVTRNLVTERTAIELYERGQVYDVMRSPDGAGVVLNDLVLVENDAPGAGRSEKGVYKEPLHAGVRVKKILRLEDARAQQAHVVLYMDTNAAIPPPYYVLVNGQRVEGVPRSWHELKWYWVPVPVEYLRPGDNEIEVVCDAAPGQGYEVLLARADEYERGGGAFSYEGHTGLLTSGFVEIPDSGELPGLTPIRVGETSARSTDGGATWKNMLLGPQADTPGEYVIRLNLQRYHASGTLVTHPIDLWTDRSDLGGLASSSRVSGLRLIGNGEAPEGTRLTWAVRFADTPDPTGGEWGDFAPIAGAAGGVIEVPDTARRFMQVRIGLETDAPLSTPVLRGLRVERTVTSTPPAEHTFYVRDLVNPEIRYPSHEMYFESADAPQLAQLRATLPASLLVRETQGQFAEINQIRHYVSKLWYHGDPHPEYPEWNALDILQRKYQYGHGGMCIQFTIVFVQALQSLGYQARHVNVFNHEVPEVYVDELEKWVVIDPESVFDSYEFNTETGMPVNILEQHGYFLKRYGFTAENPIPWASPEPWENRAGNFVPETRQPLEISTMTPWLNDPDPAKRPPQHNLAGFFRLIPRNDFLSRPTPRPVAQGSTWWPWSGYLCWYDAATPRKLQYALHSDREADFYPTLNRVRFTAVHGAREGEVDVQMTTQTPNLDTYEVNINGSGWSASPEAFTWTLFPSGLNRLEMRVKNKFGLEGVPSRIEVFYHYREPYKPKADS